MVVMKAESFKCSYIIEKLEICSTARYVEERRQSVTVIIN